MCVCVLICNDFLLGTILYLSEQGTSEKWLGPDPNNHENQLLIKGLYKIDGFIWFFLLEKHLQQNPLPSLAF